jgi:uncharacterized membrane protein
MTLATALLYVGEVTWIGLQSLVGSFLLFGLIVACMTGDATKAMKSLLPDRLILMTLDALILIVCSTDDRGQYK